MARHMGHYLDLLGIAWRGWRRRAGMEALREAAREARVVLLLIPDDALDGFARQHDAALGAAPRVHFSGSARVEGVHCCHPLGSFGPHLLSEDLYRRIVFVCDTGGPGFPQLFPDLPNRHVALAREFRGRYHAAAVLGGNFTVLLWKKAVDDLARLGLPPEAGETYMETVFENMRADLAGSLTGPLVRGDVGTVRENLRALGDDPFAEVYRAFVHAMGMEVPE